MPGDGKDQPDIMGIDLLMLGDADRPGEDFLCELRDTEDICGSASVHWISEPGGLTQFGALSKP